LAAPSPCTCRHARPRAGACSRASIDGFDRTADHRAGRLPEFLHEAGFGEIERYHRLRTSFGSLDLLVAKPERGDGDDDARPPA
jgi:hypothetical protein